MVKIRINTNTKRETVIVEGSRTLRSVLDENRINYEITPVLIDGTPLQIGDHDKTLTELGLTNEHSLSAVVKTQNA